MRLLKFEVGQYYHVYNRGTEKRRIFNSGEDHARFMRGVARSKHNIDSGEHDIGLLAYCLMPNHFHFLLRQTQENGVAEFMGRLGNGYAKYFNARNERSGRLFQAPYQAKLIGDEKYLFGLVNYIHENVSELFLHVKDDRERERAIRDYQWSSYAHYLGLRQDPFLDEAEIRHVFGQPKEYQGLFNP